MLYLTHNKLNRFQYDFIHKKKCLEYDNKYFRNKILLYAIILYVLIV